MDLPSTGHVCPSCRFGYATTDRAAAAAEIGALPAGLRAALGAALDAAQRPSPDTWSPVEYACHLRDVLVTSTIRLHRIRTEDRPDLEPMLNDLRARRFGYVRRDPSAVCDEVDLLAPGLLAEVGRVVDGARLGVRAGQARSADWFVAHAAHECRHHLRDVVAT